MASAKSMPDFSASINKVTSIVANKRKNAYVMTGRTDFCKPDIKPMPWFILMSC